MKKLIVFLMVLGFFVGGSGLAQADLSWQTTPILGTSASADTGDVVVITGPQPMNGALPYYDADGNVVLGPTIPHYSIVGDPLYHVGSPSMTFFYVGSTIATGSGINLFSGLTYGWSTTLTYLGGSTLSENNGATWSDNYTGGAFIMLYGSPLISDTDDFLTVRDVGNWKYTETWIDSATPAVFLTKDVYFTVGVPEPATMLLLGSGLIGLAGFARRRFKK